MAGGSQTGVGYRTVPDHGATTGSRSPQFWMCHVLCPTLPGLWPFFSGLLWPVCRNLHRNATFVSAWAWAADCPLISAASTVKCVSGPVVCQLCTVFSSWPALGLGLSAFCLAIRPSATSCVCAKPKIIRPLSGLVAVSCAVRSYWHTVRDLCPCSIV